MKWVVTVPENVAYLPILATKSSILYACDQAPLIIQKMEDPKSLILRWCSFSTWGTEHFAFSFHYHGRQYLLYIWRYLTCRPNKLTKIHNQQLLTLHWRSFSGCRRARVVLATGPGNAPAVRVWTAKTGQFGSRFVQQPDPLTLGGPNPDPYPSTRGFRQVWLDLSVPISGSAFRVSHLWSHSDMLLLIVK
jgi:hypothetical protein